jgi:glutamate-1-semialdehyde 2,1-aminomutase
MKFNRSEELFVRAEKVMPGGVNSPVRAFNSVEMTPLFVKSASGSKITDEDGNVYVDYISSWGPLILGHANPEVHKGVMDVFEKGISFGLSTEKEIELAELISSMYPAAQMVRMVNSGTEATMSAIRLARGYTGRNKILKFEGCYHGHFDGLLVKGGSGALTFNIPTSKGVTEDIAKDTLVAAYNDFKSVEKCFEEFGPEIAGVIIEPVAGNMGVVEGEREFISALRKITRENGTLLIFDEVITGFRLGIDGAAGYYGIEPDLACFGKVIGGGLPVGAYGGKRDIMSEVAPLGSVYQAGTLSGNPLAVHLGLNLLSHLNRNPQIYSELEKKAIKLEEGLVEGAKSGKIPVTVNRVKGMLSMFMTDSPVTTFAQVMKSDTKIYARYFRKMLSQGILFPPSQYEGLFLSAAHTDEDLDLTIKSNINALKLAGE